jgi:hypothetical protein
MILGIGWLAVPLPVGAGEITDAATIEEIIHILQENGLINDSQRDQMLAKHRAEQRGQRDVAAALAEGESSGLPGWVSKIRPFGDLRLRHDTQWKDKDSGNDSTRNRERFRVRFGLKSEITEDTEVGIRLASGSGFQNTTNQSFDSHARGKDIFIDRVYAKWKANKNFTLVGGKHKNPLFTTPLVWDPDVNPEGAAQTLNFGVNENVDLFANFGQWFVEELSGENSDPTLLAFQFGTRIEPSEDTSIQLGATYYEFFKMDRFTHDSDDINDNTTFIGYNDNTGQQLVFDDEGKLVNEWRCLELGGKVKFKSLLPVPFSIFGDYIKNFEADIDELIAKGDGTLSGVQNPANLMAYGSDDRDMGWLMGFDLGNKKKKGDWYLKYHFQVLEDYAFPAVFVDSDFHGGGTNNRGHYLHGRYFLTDNIQARATGFITERDSESKDGKSDEDRIQLDVVFSFP